MKLSYDEKMDAVEWTRQKGVSMELTVDDAYTLKDTIEFVIENDESLDRQGAKDLWKIFIKLTHYKNRLQRLQMLT